VLATGSYRVTDTTGALLGGLDAHTSGTVEVLGRDLATLSVREVAALRRRSLG
jgi:predicted ABC-type transport system involved in lysophospholipase L1 biosynthesis ATPase subunit